MIVRLDVGCRFPSLSTRIALKIHPRKQNEAGIIPRFVAEINPTLMMPKILFSSQRIRFSACMMTMGMLFLTTLGAMAQQVFLQTDFEGSSSLPTGWTQSTISGGGTWTIATEGAGGNPSSAHEGTNMARLFVGSVSDNTTRLITPSFNTVGFINLRLSFWHTQWAWFGQFQDDLKVLYSSDGGTNWTELVHYTNNISEWAQRDLNIPVTGANMRIAFEGNAKWGHGVCLDDIQVSGIPDSFSEVFLSTTDASASEVGSDPGTWTITRTGNTTGPLSVNFTLSGIATAGSDYTLNASSPLNFAAGETSKVVTLTPIDDTVGSEGDEIATLTLTAGTGYVINTGSGSISIYDDEGYDLNILVIGSTHSFSEGGENDVVHEKPFNPTTIATHLQSILAQDTVLNKTVNVVFEDVYKSKTNEVRTSKDGIDLITAHCYSLAQHFMWPDGKATRLANLRSEAGTKWDYIVLCSDPYIMANFPGMYAEGVKLIQSEVAKTVVPQGEQAPAVVLVAQWPENSSTFSADDFNEVVHRIGSSADLTVVPAGKVWDSYTGQDTSAAHPTPKGEYLAAASIYSKLYNRSASTSGYNYTPDGDAIADHALSQVQAIAAVTQYSGEYATVTPFTMKYDGKRVYNFRETGSSTEDYLAQGLDRLDDVCRISFIRNLGTFWDINYGRGNDRWEDDKDYEVDPTKYNRSYGFPMHHYYTGSAANAAAQTMPYGIDKYYFSGVYEDGTDLGIAYNMVRPNTRETGLPEGHDVRAIPIRLLWMKMEQAYPGFQPLLDNTHMARHLNDASVAFIYTLLSGRCPIVDEPTPVGSTAWQQWLGHKIGYETAWQMSHLTTRAPGFQVMPSSVSATTVTSTASETMTVRFMNPPQSNVTVTIASSNPGVATVSPATLTFTPANYATPQNITVTGVAANAGLQNFNVVTTTSSTDEIYDGIGDSWAYTSNTQSVSYGQTVLLAGFDGTNALNTTSSTAGVYKELTAPHKSSTSSANVNATFSTTAAVVNGLQWVGAMTSPSTWGSAVYTPNASTTNTGVFVADNAITGSLLIQNTGTNQVTLEKLHFRLQRDSATGGAPNQATITLASGNLATSGPGVQALSASSGAFNYDFDLSTILTDATLAAGESATFTLSFVPTDPAGVNRRIRLDNLALAGKVISAGPDNTAPTPNPMSWASQPTAVNSSSITMTATTASDPSGVEYFFDETSGNPGGTDSGWQDSPTYTDIGLNASTQYTYTVTARDKAVAMNSTVTSASASATTSAVSNPVSSSTSTVTASPTSVPADGTTTSTITVTLKDSGGAVVSGKTVSLVGNGSATIQTSNNVSNASGVVTFTVKSGTVGTETFNATGDSVAITQTANVQFTTVVTPGVTILLGGFDGNQTQTAIAPATTGSTTGVRQLTSPQQSAGASSVVSTRIWTDQATNKELQWNTTGGATDGLWGSTAFTPASSTSTSKWVATQSAASWINYEITNMGTSDVVLDKFHINAKRLTTTAAPTGSPDTLTISLQQNGTFANPPVLSASALTATGTKTITLTTPLNSIFYGFEFALSEMLSDYTLSPGEKATFRIANNAGGNRLYLDNIAISGVVGGTPPNNTFSTWISGYAVGGQTAFADDPDKDGISNGIENYFGTNPGESTAGVLAGVMNPTAGTFTFSHPINGSPAADISAAYRWSKDLSNFYYGGQSDPGGTTVTFTQGVPSAGSVSVTATMAGTSTERLFIDIEVTQD